MFVSYRVRVTKVAPESLRTTNALNDDAPVMEQRAFDDEQREEPLVTCEQGARNRRISTSFGTRNMSCP